MSERCIVAARFTPAGSLGQVRKAVGGFLRYVQHRDLHAERKTNPRPELAGLLKYVAYRDQPSARAELFGPEGTMGSAERKAFAAYVVRSLEDSRPQLYRARSGELVDRRRAVYRLVISPERARGLDLRQLTVAAVTAMESELGGDRLRWMAAIHRNTAHPHVHLVIAGMRETEDGFRRFDLTKPRLAASKAAVLNEIVRQRADRRLSLEQTRTDRAVFKPRSSTSVERDGAVVERAIAVSSAPRSLRLSSVRTGHRTRPIARAATPLLRLQAAARLYAWRQANDAAHEARQRGWEHAA